MLPRLSSGIEVVVGLPDGSAVLLTASRTESVGQLKRRAARKSTDDPSRYRLTVTATGECLDDGAKLSDCKLGDRCRLELAEETLRQRTGRVLNALREQYHKHVKPAEELSRFQRFRAGLGPGKWPSGGPDFLTDTLEHTKPMVTFLGPYSVGKTTFISHLLGTDRLHTGPEPTTDKFTVLLSGADAPGPVTGSALAARTDLPFRGLQHFGDSFQQHLVGQPLDCPLLKGCTFVDTPGMLEAASDVKKRPYDFIEVCRWFVECSDLVFIIFDPSKLDAGHELREVFKRALPGNESKVRIVLNKADSVAPWDLMRIYGALYWNLSNMIHTTEPPRLYVGSFWGQPYKPGTAHEHFKREREDLLRHVREVAPLQSVDRRVSILRSRARAVLLHSYITRWVMGEVGGIAFNVAFLRTRLLKGAVERVQEAYEAAQRRHPSVSRADYPPPAAYRKFFLPDGGAQPPPVSIHSAFALGDLIPALDTLVSKTLQTMLSKAPRPTPRARM